MHYRRPLHLIYLLLIPRLLMRFLTLLPLHHLLRPLLVQYPGSPLESQQKRYREGQRS